MTDLFIITKEMVLKAPTYMDLRTKESLSQSIAALCLKDMKIAYQNEAGQKALALPVLKKEDTALKTILLLNSFLGFYFDITLDSNEDSYEQYDYYAKSHPFNQLERLKTDTELKSKIYDILSDYREFEKMVNSEIYSLKMNNNDPLARFAATMQLMSDPASIQKLAEELKKAGNEYIGILEEKKVLKTQQKAEMLKGIQKAKK